MKERKYRIGIDVGGTKTAFGLYDEELNLLIYEKHSTDNQASQEEFTDFLAGEILDLLGRQNAGPEELAGAAACFPSSVDHRNGTVVFTPTIPALCDYHASEWFARKLPGVRIIVDNDTNAAALAEHRFGAGRGFSHMLYTSISTGIGSGLILDGKLYRGAYGGAGESGHMIIEPGETSVRCGCGNAGCFMGMTSGSGAALRVREKILAGKNSILGNRGERLEDLTAVQIREAFEKGDPLAVETLEEMGRYLGLYVFNCFCLLNCNCYVLGGGLVNFGTPLLDRIRETFDQYSRSFCIGGRTVEIRIAETGEHMGILGAALMI